ncbi:hypothetical protein BDZ91DRAFT_670579 [Kalaharituber pfeilii]|nr:hypothetical protein BDZ91DRAFT_670579 [Kalaharituber pfeilii]
MVLLPAVLSANSTLPSHIPHGSVSVFAGATSGIGLATLTAFAKHSCGTRPRIYFIGRNAEAGGRITQELKQTCPDGEVVFIQADLSLLRIVDEVCSHIKEREGKEGKINLLFVSAGIISMDKQDTSEGLDLVTAITLYSRLRLITNLLPLLQQGANSSPVLSRVVNIFAGGKGSALPLDLSLRSLSALAARSATATMTNLAMSHLALKHPQVSFVHVFPGFVRTKNQDIPGFLPFVIRTVMGVFGRWICVGLEESGERHLFHATNERYPPVRGIIEFDGDAKGSTGTPVPEGLEVAKGPDGKPRSGMYCLNWDGEEDAENKVLKQYIENGMREKVWEHVEEVFRGILGPTAYVSCSTKSVIQKLD